MILPQWPWLQGFNLKVFNKAEVVGTIIREEEVETIIIILEEVLTMVVIPIPINFRISIQYHHLILRPIINLSKPRIRIQVNQADLSVKSVVRVVIQPLIATTEWISHIKGSIHLQNLLQWWLMLLKFTLPMLGSLTQGAQIM